jgi:hypothetical protein
MRVAVFTTMGMRGENINGQQCVGIIERLRWFSGCGRLARDWVAVGAPCQDQRSMMMTFKGERLEGYLALAMSSLI